MDGWWGFEISAGWCISKHQFFFSSSFYSYRFLENCSTSFQLMISASPISMWPESHDHDSCNLTTGGHIFFQCMQRSIIAMLATQNISHFLVLLISFLLIPITTYQICENDCKQLCVSKLIKSRISVCLVYAWFIDFLNKFQVKRNLAIWHENLRMCHPFIC